MLEKILQTNFKASNGWLEHSRNKHMISYKCINGESISVKTETIDEWLSELPSVIDDYAPEDILNTDETGLLYCALPNKKNKPEK